MGSRIKKLRRDSNLSLMALAKDVGLSDMALSKIETGKTKSITIDKGKGLARALGVSFAELFEIEPAKSIGEAEIMKKNEELAQLIESLEKTIQEKDEFIQLQRQQIGHIKYTIVSALSVAEQFALSDLMTSFEKKEITIEQSVTFGVLMTATRYLEMLKNHEVLGETDMELFRKMEEKGFKEMAKKIKKYIANDPLKSK
ncbi:MAG: helix-turn-helix transcriptional regulator [Verrucomicrobiota bacterium]